MDHSANKRGINPEFLCRRLDLGIEWLGEQWRLAPVDAGFRVTGVTVEADNVELGTGRLYAAIRHHAIVIGVAVDGIGAGGGPGLAGVFHVGEFHGAIRMHNTLDAVCHGGCRQKEQKRCDGWDQKCSAVGHYSLAKEAANGRFQLFSKTAFG